ncbi:MAG: dTDP-4-dehydrorhamnose reductase [Erysipelotrichaceae bacterium]|nr:dTDP-4-dehydrorhamnose reductase [Erysipelotrichaceae bacterium]
MKILVVGASGQLGKTVVDEVKKRNHECVSVDVAGDVDFLMDATNYDEVLFKVEKVNPDAVINCAAWTAVDAAEEEDNQPKVFALNTIIPKNLAEACKAINCKLMQISTDYVFDGTGERPWCPDDKNFGPLSIYGMTKLKGENFVSQIEKYFVVRIAWLFGGPVSFVNTMLKVGKTHDEVKVVNDQIGTPTYSKDLARLLVDMIETDKYGYYHATNEGGYISWYDFCVEIYKQAGYTTKVIPVTTAEYGISKAKRPFNSRLDKSKLVENGFKPLPDWKDALRRYLSE